MGELFSVFASEMILFGQYVEARRNLSGETKRIFSQNISSMDQSIDRQFKMLEKMKTVQSPKDLELAIFAFKVSNVNLGFFAKTLGWHSDNKK